MNLITDEILHEYILNPTILDKSIINEIAKRVSGSEVFKERVDNIRDFYDDYYKLSDNNNDNIDTTKKTRSIRLHPLFSKHVYKELHPKIAAQSKETGADNFNYIRTFASARNLVLIRLLYNPITNVYRLFLIGDDMNIFKNTKVKIPELNLDLISDNNGIVDIKNYNIEDVEEIIIER